MSDANLTLPTEIIQLPSKGLLYPKENPLSSGTLEMKYMTAREEDILTNQNLIQNGTVFDKLLKSLIVSKINFDDLTVGDKNAILIAARILGYGKDYQIKYPHPVTGELEDVTIDLGELKNKDVDYSQYNNENEFSYVLPTSNNEIIFKILTHRDERMIDEELKNLKKANLSGEITTRLRHAIIAVNGNRERKTVTDFVNNFMLASDARALRECMRKTTPDLNLSFTFNGSDGYTQEGVDLPLGISFFYPSTRV